MNKHTSDPTVTISSTEINDITDFSTTNSKIYSKNEKKIIASRMEQIKNKKINLKIFQIIYNDNGNYLINPNGVFLNLNNLSDISLSKIERVLNLYDDLKNEKKNEITWNNIIQNQEITVECTNESNLNSYEKNFLKKQQLLTENNYTLWGSSVPENNN
jgi:hypothetical protein